jgi:hypothetical protein
MTSMKSRMARSILARSVLARSVLALAASIFVLDGVVSATGAAEETTETIVLIRHGEKPPNGLGQLNCQGLNRALALPAVIQKAFGRPLAIFAPNPAEQKADYGKLYDYVRPLATIEPTAIALGLPINSDIGQSRIEDLRNRLELPMYHDGFVLVAWEHWQIVQLARAIMKNHGGKPETVPEWKSTDFDSMYVLKIRRSGSNATATFELAHEGLNGQPTTCPGGADNG